MSDKKEITLVAGSEVIPADKFTIKDSVYGERYFTRDGQGYKEVTKSPIIPIRIHADRSYILDKAASFTDAINRYGDPEKGIIFYSDKSVTMFFEEDNRKETINLPLAHSLELKSFLSDDGEAQEFTQKDFLNLIDIFPECIEGTATLRPNVERVQLSTQIDFEGNVDPNNIKFLYQEKGGSQTGTIPRKVVLTLPFFEGSKNKVTIEAKLEIEMPKTEGQKPLFTLTDVRHERTAREALEIEIKSLSAAVQSGWLFVNGKF